MSNLAFLWQQTNGLFKAVLSSIFIFVGFWLFSRILLKKMLDTVLQKDAIKTRPAINILLSGFKPPCTVYLQYLGILLAVLAFTLGIKDFGLPPTLANIAARIPFIVGKGMRIGAVVAIAVGLVSSSGITSLILHSAKNKVDLQAGQSVSHFLAAVFNVVVVAIALVIILSELNYDINGLIAGLGLGGLTIALAAKDSASNFFGGLVLIIEKPFEIGDWITCKSVEGTVENISLRSTKVRTSAGSLTIVPNAVLSAEPITNWSGAMEKRRADFLLNFVYETSKENLQAFVAKAEEVLKKDSDILDEGIIVRFANFEDSGLAVRVVFYTALPGFAEHIAIKERINYALMELAKKQGVEFAFPTQTLYVSSHSKNL